MDKRRKQLKPLRKGKSKKEQKTRKWRDKGGKGCPGPTTLRSSQPTWAVRTVRVSCSSTFWTKK